MRCLFQTMHSAPGSVVVCMPGPTWLPLHLKELSLHRGLEGTAESKPGCVHSDTGPFFRKLSGSDMFAEGDSWRFAQDCPVGNCSFQTRETDVDPEPWL